MLASRDWHEGVIGIVASRLVERYGRPVVLIAIGDEEAKGSGRSIPAYDLHAGLTACAEHLEKFGGHRAAAGLSIDPAAIAAFGSALAEHAEAAMSDATWRPGTGSTPCWRRPRCRWSWPTSWHGWSRSGWATRASPCWPRPPPCMRSRR